ncbi:MAG: hypothetical protein HXY35_02020 [Chloroflexi bacterium]|nr:hypothetical protein [Chloroflexota bacterium]
MDTSTFYAMLSATCFTLVGLWWNVVRDKSEWMKDEAKKRMAGGVYASFLIPALMSLGAQIGGTNHLIWQGVFIIAAGAGITFSSKLIQLTRAANGAFSRNSWTVPVLYGIVLFFALFPGLARIVGLEPLQMEGLLLCILILIAHAMTWEFMTSA